MQGGQVHLGMRRRCLHFDDDQQNNTTNGADPRNAFGNEGVSSSEVPIAELGHINPSSLEPAPPPYRQLPTLTLPQTSGKPIIQGTKPSGFGLHLNSIINSVQCGATISMKRMGSGSFSIRGKSSSVIRLHSSESSRSGPLSCNETNQLAKISNNNIDRDQAIAATSEAVSFSHSSKLEEVEASKLLGPIYCDKRKYSTSNNIIEEISQSNPNKRRLKRLDNDDSDGCKNCNCKKTKCLKLYCECFAAGIYCAESCSCQGCFNKPEHENIVIDTRKQVESRNPHAFAPKIIQHATATSTKRSTKDGVLSSSSKHKRGCNCKKSMCIKKYCECYQANVGCSDGCRCDGCQNVFGRKEGYENNKHLHKQGISEACDVATGRELPKVATTIDTSCTQPFSPHELTPRTPSYQDSNDGKDRSKSWYPSTRYLPSPESATVADSYLMSLGSSGNISNLGIVQVVNKDNLELVPSHQKLDDVNLIDVDEFSPRYHGHGSISNPPSLLGPHDWATTMGPQPISENCNFSPASSLQWRRSPISSMTSFEENKYHGAMDSDSGLYEGLEDDTPDILKNNVTPFNSVKLCSPNQKRVSPPHTIMQELCSSSSSVLKSCRKFILKSVPSFPPIDPKDKNPDARQC